MQPAVSDLSSDLSSGRGRADSRYFPYGEESYSEIIIENYTKHGLPLSVGVLDVPWHNINYAVSDLGPDKQGTAPPGRGCNGWDGFTFNRTLFPEPQRFFDKVCTVRLAIRTPRNCSWGS